MAEQVKENKANEPEKKGRNQTAMKILLGFLILLAIPGGWITYKVKVQRKAISWINEMGGDVMYDIQLGDKGEFLQEDEMKAQPKGWMLNYVGMDYVSDIAAVMMPDANISDLSPLANLKNIQDFSIGGNQVKDISLLSGMSRLRDVNLAGNPVSDLSALAGLKSLEKLTISGCNELTDLSPLKDSSLNELNASSSAVTDLSPLAGLLLKRLNLENSKVSDLGPLAEVPSLTHLYLSNSPVSDLSALAELKQLEYINLDGSLVSDLSSLSGLENLKGVNIWNAKIDQDDVDALQAKLPNVGIVTEKPKPQDRSGR